MPVSITCRKTEISESLHDVILQKSRKLKKYFEKVDKIEVVFMAEKHRKICEITVHGAPFTFNAVAENGQERAAFDKALKLIQRQIKDSKGRMIDRKRKAVNMDREHGGLAAIEEEEESVGAEAAS